MRILIVCTANVCRSPMAEAVLRQRFEARGFRAQAGSAGVEALPDQAAHPLSIAAIAEAGYGDLSAHRSRLLSPRLLREADFVLCMEHAHRSAIVARTPEFAGRARLLGHWRALEIADPVNGPPQGFTECLELMTDCIDQWVERLARQGLLA